MQVCVHTFVCVCVQRPEIDIRCLSLTVEFTC